MSAHGSRATSRHPSTTRFVRERFEVGPLVFEVVDHPENGVTFGVRAAVELVGGKLPPLLFSAVVPKGMATQLRKLRPSPR